MRGSYRYLPSHNQIFIEGLPPQLVLSKLSFGSQWDVEGRKMRENPKKKKIFFRRSRLINPFIKRLAMLIDHQLCARLYAWHWAVKANKTDLLPFSLCVPKVFTGPSSTFSIFWSSLPQLFLILYFSANWFILTCFIYNRGDILKQRTLPETKHEGLSGVQVFQQRSHSYQTKPKQSETLKIPTQIQTCL